MRRGKRFGSLIQLDLFGGWHYPSAEERIDSSDPITSGLRALLGREPFPWQVRMARAIADGRPPRVVALPTGCGKTAIIACWVVARALEPAKVPRRICWVINRRADVDQASSLADSIAEAVTRTPELDSLIRAQSATGEGLAVSTLRGKRADNGEWRGDISRPAIIIGTVDGIGSRLLFSSYWASPRSRARQAGIVGQDCLLVADESHLEPAFATLLERVERIQRDGCDPWPIRTMAVSATPRGMSDVFALDEADLSHPVLSTRLAARKDIRLTASDDVLGDLTRMAVERGGTGEPVVVFVSRVEAVKSVAAALRKAHGADSTTTIAGPMRGWERDQMASTDPVFARFLPGADQASGPAFLVCTSAGEVGIDFSSVHLVSDLTTLDGLCQRLGRVNRFGEKAGQIDIVHPRSFRDDDRETRLAATLEAVMMLHGNPGGTLDGSPSSLSTMLAGADTEACFAMKPWVPPLGPELIEAWATGSSRGEAPPVDPHLHGISPDEPPRLSVAWREEVGIFTDPGAATEALGIFPLQPAETLSDIAGRVEAELRKIATRRPSDMAWGLSPSGEVTIGTVADMAERSFRRANSVQTVILPPSAGGLEGGMLAGGSTRSDGLDVSCELEVDGSPLRARIWGDEATPPAGMTLTHEVRLVDDPESDEPAIRVWRWYRNFRDIEQGAESGEQTLDRHHRAAIGAASAMATALGLPEPMASSVVLAAGQHDAGKAVRLWQSSIGAQPDGPILAKSLTPTPGMGRKLRGYRHELGSLIGWEGDDLASHLVATHHGRGRPLFPARESYIPGTAEGEAGRLITGQALRFATQTRTMGPWGLAYLEAILSTIDGMASSQPSRWERVQPTAVATPVMAQPRSEVMPAITTKADPSNAGHFLACCGLLHLADTWWEGGALGWFSRDSFHLAPAGAGETPHPVRILASSGVATIPSIPGTGEIPEKLLPLIVSPASGDLAGITIDHHARIYPDRTEVRWTGGYWKFWSGPQSSLGIWETLAELLTGLIGGEDDDLTDALTRVAISRGRFGYDPQAAWNASGIGWSPSKQAMGVASRPALEMLAFIGLQRFRPTITSGSFTYSAWEVPLPPAAAIVAAFNPLAFASGPRVFRGIIDSRGEYRSLGDSQPGGLTQ